jgi:hypothetical protein
MSFPHVPVYQEIASFIMKVNIRFPASYALFGGLLWIFGFPQTREAAKTDESR